MQFKNMFGIIYTCFYNFFCLFFSYSNNTRSIGQILQCTTYYFLYFIPLLSTFFFSLNEWQGWFPSVSGGGNPRGSPRGRGVPAVGRGVPGVRNPPAFNNQPPAYPLRAGGFGALRQDKGHHRYNPVGGFNAPGFNPYHGWN